MKIISSEWKIDGIVINNLPVDWQSTKINGIFDQLSNRSVITTDRFIFHGDAAQIIKNRAASGTTGGVGITEGLPFSVNMVYTPDSSSKIETSLFNGYLDYFDNYENINSQTVAIGAKLVDQVTELLNRMQGTSVDVMASEGAFKSSDFIDVEYVVEPDISFIEVLLMLLSLYLMLKEIYEAGLRLGTTIASISGISSSSVTGSVGAVLFTALQIIAELIYIALMVVAVIELVDQLFALITSPFDKMRVISYKNLIQRTVEYFGYEFKSDIKDLETLYYMPSYLNRNSKRGLPNAGDYGYSASQIIGLMEQTFKAKSNIEDGVWRLEWLGSDYWKKDTSLIIDKQSPDKRDNFSYNTENLRTGTFISFLTDPSDIYTIDNFSGTNYTVSVAPKTVINQSMVGITGLYNENFPMALANRKEKLKDSEELLVDLDDIVNELLSIFGSSSSFSDAVKNRKGAIRISENQTSRPKMVRLSGNKIPTNHRSTTNAKYFYDNYHYLNSFVDYPEAQKLKYKDPEYPLTPRELNIILNNNRAIDWQGRTLEFTKFESSFNQDTADVEFNVEQVYINNLTETKIDS